MSTPTSSPASDGASSRSHIEDLYLRTLFASDDKSVGKSASACSRTTEIATAALKAPLPKMPLPDANLTNFKPSAFPPVPSFEELKSHPRSSLSPGQKALIAPAPARKLNQLPEEIAKKRKRGSGEPVSLFAPSLSSSSSSSSVPPPTPVQTSKTNYSRPYTAEIETVDVEGRQYRKNFRFTREHFLTFRLPGEATFLTGEGNYKNAYTYTHSSELIPGIANNKIVLLQFKEKGEGHIISAQKLFTQMDTSLKQYFEARVAFASDKCVNIYNAKKALEDGYFAVEYIPLSLEGVLQELSHKVTAPLTSFDDTQNPVVINIKSLLEQIRFFFTKSLQHKIQTDLNIGNFRLFKNDDGSYIVKLTDFREEIDEDDDLVSSFFGADSDLTGDKNGELNKLINNRYVKSLISNELYEEFFKAEREQIVTLNS